jgi:hypothetical protein
MAKARIKPGNALDYLQAIYRGEIEADPWRVRAAALALPFECPKLAVTAYVTDVTSSTSPAPSAAIALASAFRSVTAPLTFPRTPAPHRLP